MKTIVYNQSGENVGEATLPKEIFEVKMNRDLMHQVIIAQQSNRRQVLADTKSRAEVSGGGKKPWRQKGTGRARAGTNRSPIWRHGGITFGPRTGINFKKEIPNQMRKKALFMALSDRAKSNELVVLEDLKLKDAKTKLMVEVLSKLPSKGKSALIALPSMDKALIRAGQNIDRIEIRQAKDLNCLDILSFHYLIILKESIKVIKETFAK